MADQRRLADVGKYIEKYYVPVVYASAEPDREVRTDTQPDLGVCADAESDRKVYASAESVPEACENAAPPGRRRLGDLLNEMDETFSRKLLRMIRERGMKEADVYKKAHIDRRHFSKIKKNADYMPNRTTVLAFAIALGLTLDETKDLLKSAGYALSRSSKFDVIIAYFLEQQIYDFFEINEVLYAYGEPVFE